MKTTFSRRDDKGFSLVASLIILAIISTTMGGILLWTSQTSNLSQRYNEMQTSLYAAESAMQKIRSSLLNTYQNLGEPSVALRINSYETMPPVSSDDPISSALGMPLGFTSSAIWNNYSYSDPSGSGVSVYVAKTGTNVLTELPAPFTGLTAMSSKYQIITTVANTSSRFGIPVNFGVEIAMQNIPLFQFAMFCETDLEINPGSAMTIGGVVHGNRDIYISGSSVIFSNDVSATGVIYQGERKDSSTATVGTYTYDGVKTNGVSYQRIPVGTNQTELVTNQEANVRAILEIPPDDEPYGYNSVGTNRYYNKADLILKITDTNVIAQSARYRGNSTILTNFSSNILNTNLFFYDWRESSYMKSTGLDVGNLKTYLESTNSLQLSALLGGSNVSTLYIVDLRDPNAYTVTPKLGTNAMSATSYTDLPTNYVDILVVSNVAASGNTKPVTNTYYGTITNTHSYPKYRWAAITGFQYTTNSDEYTTNFAYTTEPAIVLTNGATLPESGLTIATPDPVYVWGNYNVSTNGTTFYTNTADTSHTRPSAILCDAITLLSANFTTSYATNSSKSSRTVSAPITVNSAMLTGNVPTIEGGAYSGGFENFLRLLEDWSKVTLYYNGSMITMFESQIADGRWNGNVYGVPKSRAFTFDKNFLNTEKLPKSTPQLNSFAQGKWRVLPLGATSVQ